MSAAIRLKIPIFLICVCAILTACCTMFSGRAYASDGGNPVVVSMGDSFSAGEGVEDFYDQDKPNKYNEKQASYI